MKILLKEDYSIKGKDSDGILYYLGGNEDKGLYFPFILYVPYECEKDTNVIFYCPTPLSYNDKNFDEAIDATYKELKLGPVVKRASLKYHIPVIIPVIPKYAGLNTAYLGSSIYHNDFGETKDNIKSGKCQLNEKDLEKFIDIPNQVCTMIRVAKDFLIDLSYEPMDKIIMEGYSAGCKFATHFTFLYPNLVKMVIGGGTVGLIPLPLKEINDYKLNFPLGINDLPNFNFEIFRQIQQFYYIGEDDFSDPAIPKCIMDENSFDEVGNMLPLLDEKGNRTYITDEEGNYQARFKGLYTDYDINAINKGISDNTQIRFDKIRKIYEEMGINAEFKKYLGNHKTVFCQELYEDVFEQYEKLINKDYKR